MVEYLINMSRDIGFIRWKDPLAWMEEMKGTPWLRVLQKENLHFNTAVSALSTGTVKQFEDKKPEFQRGEIYTTPAESWRWKDETTVHAAAVVFCEGETVWAVEESGDGKEKYTLSCYTKKGKQWHSTISIGPYLCVKNGRCYVLETTSELRYGACISLSAKTGKGKHLIFTEPSLEANLSLEGDDFLCSDRSGYKTLYHIENEAIKRLEPRGVSFVTVSDGNTEPCFFARLDDFSAPWTPFGKELTKYKLPLTVREYGIDFFSIKHSLLVTSAGGVRRVYKCFSDRAPEKINEFLGTAIFDRYTANYIVKSPGSTPSVYAMNKCIIKGKNYATPTLEKAKSLDGTIVPYVLVVKPGKMLRGLMCIQYGGYGISTGLDTARWRPYLEAGWAITFALVRGGGDYGDCWADAARTYRKARSIEDTECVIRSAQKKTGISWKKTCLYGRSAGGYTLGAIVARHGEGGLIGAAYTEVPYVDLLRTTTNPRLPLTVLEYNEFGNPAKKLEDLETILQLSPVDTLPEEGAPAIFVVARTSLNDREVLPYESVKWITKLRGFPTPTEGAVEKYLSILDGHGHFVKGNDGIQQKNEDFILLNGWLTS